MRKIELTQGKHALVDDADYESLNQLRWHYSNRGYAQRNGTLMHRVIMATPIGLDTDHINGDKLDNRKSNLRICTRQENCLNKVGKRNNALSQYKGVYLLKTGKYSYWRADITRGKSILQIGYFKNERHAAMAYDLWAKDLHGEFAKTNFPILTNKYLKDDIK